MGKTFDICFTLVRENLPFRRYPAIHELEIRDGVDLGLSYATKDSTKSFTHYVAESQRSGFKKLLSNLHFYSFLMNGTTDAGNIEDELFFIMSFYKDDKARESCGLITCIKRTLQNLGVHNVMSKVCVLSGKPIVVGGGTDGTLGKYC